MHGSACPVWDSWLVEYQVSQEKSALVGAGCYVASAAERHRRMGPVSCRHAGYEVVGGRSRCGRGCPRRPAMALGRGWRRRSAHDPGAGVDRSLAGDARRRRGGDLWIWRCCATSPTCSAPGARCRPRGGYGIASARTIWWVARPRGAQVRGNGRGCWRAENGRRRRWPPARGAPDSAVIDLVPLDDASGEGTDGREPRAVSATTRCWRFWTTLAKRWPGCCARVTPRIKHGRRPVRWSPMPRWRDPRRRTSRPTRTWSAPMVPARRRRGCGTCTGYAPNKVLTWTIRSGFTIAGEGARRDRDTCPRNAWTAAVDADGEPRDGAQVADLTGLLDHLEQAGRPWEVRVGATRNSPNPGGADDDGRRRRLGGTTLRHQHRQS